MLAITVCVTLTQSHASLHIYNCMEIYTNGSKNTLNWRTGDGEVRLGNLFFSFCFEFIVFFTRTRDILLSIHFHLSPGCEPGIGKVWTLWGLQTSQEDKL